MHLNRSSIFVMFTKFFFSSFFHPIFIINKILGRKLIKKVLIIPWMLELINFRSYLFIALLHFQVNDHHFLHILNCKYMCQCAYISYMTYVCMCDFNYTVKNYSGNYIGHQKLPGFLLRPATWQSLIGRLYCQRQLWLSGRRWGPESWVQACSCLEACPYLRTRSCLRLNIKSRIHHWRIFIKRHLYSYKATTGCSN